MTQKLITYLLFPPASIAADIQIMQVRYPFLAALPIMQERIEKFLKEGPSQFDPQSGVSYLCMQHAHTCTSMPAKLRILCICFLGLGAHGASPSLGSWFDVHGSWFVCYSFPRPPHPPWTKRQ